MRAYAFAAIATAFFGSAMAIEKITVKGNAFFAGDKRFYIRGVDYQPGGASKVSDPLADTDNCKRDIPYFKELGINTVRIYTVDNSADHKECMKELEDAGIYLVLDVNTPTISINRNDPKATYNEKYLQHVFATIDVFSKYDNTLGFFSANEVVNAASNTASATYVKAVTRDMRNYIKKRGYRQLPVGYSAADVAENREEMAAYLNCGDDDIARSDFFAFNDYSWCGSSSYTKSGWDKKVETYKDYSIPLFLSEFGCNEPSPRKFEEIGALYDSSKMTPVFSGGLVYEYSQEPNNYGLVELSDDRKSAKKRDDFDVLKKQYKSVGTPDGDGGYKKDGKPSTCPKKEKGTWEADDTLPEMPTAAKKYLENGAGKPLGDQNLMTGGSGSGSSSGGSSSSSSGNSTSGEKGAAAMSSVSSVLLSCIVGASTIAAGMMAL